MIKKDRRFKYRNIDSIVMEVKNSMEYDVKDIQRAKKVANKLPLVHVEAYETGRPSNFNRNIRPIISKYRIQYN